MKSFCLLMSLFLCVAVPAQVAAIEPDAFAHSTQLIVVTTSDWNAVDGQLQRYERSAPREKWRRLGEPIPVVVGKSGMGWGIGIVATNDRTIRNISDPVKKEGDGRSPAGVFPLGSAFGDDSQPLPGLKMPYLSLTPSIECVDDSGSKHYNRLVDRATVAPDWNSSEHMRSVGEAYRWGIVVGHNGGVAEVDTHAPTPEGGSCVFLHIWGGPDRGTAGCTAMPQSDLETLLTWLDPADKPLLVQAPVMEYSQLVNLWRLPPLTNAAPR